MKLTIMNVKLTSGIKLNMKIYFKTIIFGIPIFLLSFQSQSLAQVYEYQFTPPASVDSNGFAHYKIYVPEDVDTIKGIYCYLPGWQGSTLNTVYNLDYQEYAREKDMALMCFRMLGAYTNSILGISLWSGEALINGLAALADSSGHPEIENSALLFDGWSAGGQFSYHFTQWKPERVIAFVTMKGGYHSLSPAGDAIHVPGYMFIGENDLEYRIINLTTIFETNRPFGAIWALAMEPDAGHNRVTNEIIHPYFDHIVPMRLPEEIPVNTIPTLLEIQEDTGWLGDRGNYEIAYYPDFTGDITKASWFPNETIAQQWQNFVQGLPISGIEINIQKMPRNIVLYQNNPNPLRTSTCFKYELQSSAWVTLNIYDHAGQLIETLVNDFQNTGEYEKTWQPDHTPDGIYLYQLKADGFSETKKLILLR